MRISKLFVKSCCLLAALGSVGSGAEFALTPVSATGDHSFSGNEIILEGGGQRVFIDLQASGWSPVDLKSWQAVLDSTTYSSGLMGVLTPAMEACSDHSTCVGAFGTGALCDVPPFAGVTCTPGFMDGTRIDYIFYGYAEMPGVDLSTLNYRYASTVLMLPVPDPGTIRYAGTLVLEVPPDAIGTFTVSLLDGANIMQDSAGGLISPLIITPGVITVLCQTNDDCDDGNDCTNDTCENNGPLSGSCTYTDDYDPEVDCCRPTDGALTQIDDENECTTDVCDPDTGQVTHEPVLDGTSCDDDLFCTDGETCTEGLCGGGSPPDCSYLDGQCTLGVCNENLNTCVAEPINEGLGCDDGLYCTDDDSCSGGVCTGPAHDCSYLDDQCNVGICNEALDTCQPLQINENDPCDDGDHCNVGETCQSGECLGGDPQDCSTAGPQCNTASCDPGGAEGNCDILTPVTNGTPCDDELYCNVDEECTDGTCGGGADRDCDDGIACTEDTCNEGGNTCVNMPDDGECPDDGLFCNGDEYCDTDTGCDHTGNPCAGPCDEEFDRCLCETPDVDQYYWKKSQRYLSITPMPLDSGPQAILITPDCPGGEPWYVGPPTATIVDGLEVNVSELVAEGSEAWRTPTEWGDLYVFGEMITPGTTYRVQGDCGSPGNPGYSGAAVVTTAIWGDVAGGYMGGGIWAPPDGLAQITDILIVIEKFKGILPFVPTYWADIVGFGQTGVGCVPDLSIDIIDATAAVDGFKQIPYEDTTGCPIPCP